MKKIDGRIIQLKKRLGNTHQVNEVIEEMAEKFNVTELYLKQLFKQQTGQTILQFDKEIRLEKAKHLLETTYKRVKEICFEVGLNDYSHFVRDFKSKYGISPKELQRQSWLKKANQVEANESE